MNELLLGVDVGLTMVKAALFDLSGQQVSVEARRCASSIVAPQRVERGMDELWATCAEVVRDCVAGAPKKASIASVGVIGHGEGAYLIDGQHRPVRPAIVSLDSRGAPILAAWRETGKLAAMREQTGQEPVITSLPVVCTWLIENEPEAMQRTRWILRCKDWIRLRLTGAVGSDPTDAGVLTDLSGERYSDEALELLGLGDLRAKLPPLSDSASVVGAVTAEASSETGLPEGTPVVCGSHDLAASAVGMGAVADRQLGLVAGTFSVSQVVTDRLRLDRRWQTRRFFASESWLSTACAPAATSSLEWLLKQLGEDLDSYAKIEREMQILGPGPGRIFFHPNLYGMPNAPEVGGAFVGLRAWHDSKDLLRAVLEGVVYGQRMQVDALRDAFELAPVARLTGGATRSGFWSQLFADGLGIEIEITDADQAGALGAAVLAGLGVGAWPSLADAVDATVRVGRSYRPDPDRIEAYERAYRTFRELSKALAPHWQRL